MERLLATRLTHPGHPGEYRSGVLALTFARAIAARHGGDLTTDLGPDTVTGTGTVTLPAAAVRRPLPNRIRREPATPLPSPSLE